MEVCYSGINELIRLYIDNQENQPDEKQDQMQPCPGLPVISLNWAVP